MESIEFKLFDFIVDNNIATEDEIKLVTGINGWSENVMFDIIYERTGIRSYEQCVNEGYTGTDDLDCYYGLGEESRKNHARDVIRNNFKDVVIDDEMLDEYIDSDFVYDYTDEQIIEDFEDFYRYHTDDESDED